MKQIGNNLFYSSSNCIQPTMTSKIECKTSFERVRTMRSLISNNSKILLHGPKGSGKRFIVDYLSFHMEKRGYSKDNIIIHDGPISQINIPPDHTVVEFRGLYDETLNEYADET